MNKVIITMLSLLGMSGKALACAICGCSASFMGLGYISGVGLNYIGMNYQYNYSHTQHPILFDGDNPIYSTDYFHKVSIWGGFQLNERLFFNYSLPFHSNILKEEGKTTIINGVGDPLLAVHYTAYKTPDTSFTKIRHMLLIGGGVRLPLGQNDFKTVDNLWAPNLQPGRASFGFWTNLNYSLLIGNGGINTDLSAFFTSVSSNNYKYGNRYSSTIVGFYKILLLRWTLVPQVGISGVVKQVDLLNASSDILNTMSGGWKTGLVAGIGIHHQNFGIRIQVRHPLVSYLGNGHVQPGQTAQIQLKYYF